MVILMGEWNKVKLSEIASFTTGKLNSNAAVELGKYPFFTCSPETLRIDDYAFDQEAILLAGNNAEGNFNIKYYEGRFNAYQRTYVFSAKDNCDLRFLYYSLKLCLGNFKRISQGTATKFLTAKILNSFELMLPDLEVQRQIAGILSMIDNKIELNTKINDNLEQQAFALFDSLFPAVSAGENSIGDYITPKRGKNLLSKNAVFGDIPVVAGGLEPSTYHNVANTSSPVLTISASGANSGFVRLWDIPVWSSDSSYIDVTMTPHVYFWYVMLKKRQKEIYDSQTGSAQPHIYPQHIAVMPVVELNDEDVNSFTEQVTPLFRMIGANVEENNRLASVRDALLPRLMSGELDVSNIDI